MKQARALLILLAAGMVLPAFGRQAAPSAPESRPVSIAGELGSIFLKYGGNKKTLQTEAARLALRCRKQLSRVGDTVKRIETEADAKFHDTDWAQKGQLAMELWRIRSSINLLSLLSPEVFKEVTGYEIPNLQLWMNGLKEADAKIRASF